MSDWPVSDLPEGASLLRRLEEQAARNMAAARLTPVAPLDTTTPSAPDRVTHETHSANSDLLESSQDSAWVDTEPFPLEDDFDGPPSLPAEGSVAKGALDSPNQFGLLLTLCFVVGVLALPWSTLSHRNDLPAVEHLPATAAGLSGRPANARVARSTPWQVTSDADSSTESTMIRELTGSSDDATRVGHADFGPGRESFGVLRYDSLRQKSGAWQVVTPMSMEELYAVVRADSPLRHLQDLQSRRINVGPADGERARSANALYRSLFGQDIPGGAWASWSRDAALEQLLDGGAIDALLVFDGQPSDWWARMPESARNRLRLLSIEPEDPATGRALSSYFRASLSAPEADQLNAKIETLGVMTFLVVPANERRPLAIVQALCNELPTLRHDGHSKWREVRPGLALPTELSTLPQTQVAKVCAESHPIPVRSALAEKAPS